MAQIFSTKNLKPLMPNEILGGMVKDVQGDSTVARLSAREPMKFGEHSVIVFNDFPKMEYVAEGAQKASTTAGLTSVQVVPRKGQVTLRFNQEVLWADEDHQLGVLAEVAKAGSLALARGLDLGVYHRINPLTGQPINDWTNYVTATSNSVVLDEEADVDASFRAAVGLLANAHTPKNVTGAAMDPRLVWALSELKDRDGRERYPQLGFGTNVTSFKGIPTAVSSTVSGEPEAADTKVRGIVGDFRDGIRWGIQRQLPLEVIEAGDPDGQGDLKRQNQIAIRLEIVYAWHVFTERFATIKAA